MRVPLSPFQLRLMGGVFPHEVDLQEFLYLDLPLNPNHALHPYLTHCGNVQYWYKDHLETDHLLTSPEEWTR